MAAEAEGERALNGFGDGIELRAARQGWRVYGFDELDAPKTAVGVRLRQTVFHAEAVEVDGA